MPHRRLARIVPLRLPGFALPHPGDSKWLHMVRGARGTSPPPPIQGQHDTMPHRQPSISSNLSTHGAIPNAGDNSQQQEGGLLATAKVDAMVGGPPPNCIGIADSEHKLVACPDRHEAAGGMHRYIADHSDMEAVIDAAFPASFSASTTEAPSGSAKPPIAKATGRPDLIP